jgi:hypothetical protein
MGPKMRNLVLVAALLLSAGAAYGITVTRTEGRVEDVTVCIKKQPGDPSFLISFRTFDGDVLVREIGGRDVWSQLSTTQKNQIRNIIDAVSSAVYSSESIPTPTPAQ